LPQNYSCSVMVNGDPITLALWDTAGQEDYDQIRPLSYASTDVFVVCFSVLNPTSFEHVRKKWVPEVRQAMPGAPIVLCGCKTDLREDPNLVHKLWTRSGQRPVGVEEGMQLARDLNCAYAECSALTQKGLKEVFHAAVKQALAPPLAEKRRARSPFERVRAFVKSIRRS
jgi:cell division control protein 42